jgi:hypothetical protein
MDVSQSRKCFRINKQLAEKVVSNLAFLMGARAGIDRVTTIASPPSPAPQLDSLHDEIPSAQPVLHSRGISSFTPSQGTIRHFSRVSAKPLYPLQTKAEFKAAPSKVTHNPFGINRR